jgi:riboflavin biosynthesis pyrimidine reductase
MNNKIKVICHMATSIDGKILTAHWQDEPWAEKFSGLFEKYHGTFNSEAWILGRVSMEKDFSQGVKPQPVEPAHPITRKAFIGDPNASSFAIAVDKSGKLGWKSNNIVGDHIIELLSEEVSDAYLNYLQQKQISYVFGGKSALDFTMALQELQTHFPIRTLMLEGGGHLNGSFLNAGLIDELSVLLLPIADGTPKTTSLFEVGDDVPKKPASEMILKEVQPLEDGVLWLKYIFNSAAVKNKIEI